MGHDAAPTDSRSWASAVRRLALPACGGSCLQSKQRTFTDTAVEHAASDHLPIATSCGALVATALVSTIQLAPKAPNCAANLVGVNPDYAAAVGQSSYAVLDGAIPALALLKQRSSDAEPAGVAAGVGGLLAKRSPLGAGQTIGTITAWQLLASDVQQEIQEAEAVAAAGSEAAQAFLEGRTIVGQEDLLGGATVHQQQQFVPTLPGQQVLPGAGGGSSESEDPAALLERCLDSDVGQLFDDGSGAMVGRRSSSLGGEPSPRSSAAGWGSSNAAEAGGSAASGHTSGELPFSTGETAFSGSKGNEPVGSSRFEQCYIGHEELGRGAFGRAIRAERRGDGAQVCVKVLQSGSMFKQERSMAADEVRVLSRLCHPNIVAYQECFQEGGQHFIVMEYCECGDLERFLKQRKGELLTEDELMLKFVQLCLALHHVHAKGILHRDIKTNNIFCTRHGILKLGDFGVSKVMEANQSCARTMVGTPYYLSPELVQDKPYNSKSDVWALGCVLYELAALWRPFTGHSVSAIAVKILRGQYAPLPEHYSPQLQQLVGLLLSRKVDRRPTVEQVLGCEYVREHLRRYRTHIEQFVEHRRASYAHSLVPFQLDAEPAVPAQQHEASMAACSQEHNQREAAPATLAASLAGEGPAVAAAAVAAVAEDRERLGAVPGSAAATALGQQPRDVGTQKAAPCTACGITPAEVSCSSTRSTSGVSSASRHGSPGQAASKAVPPARQSGSGGLPASPRASRFRVVEEGSGRGGGAGGSAGCTSRASRQSSPSKASLVAERRQGSSAAPKPGASPNSSCSIAAQRDGNYAASRPARKLAAAAAPTPAAPAKAAPLGRSTGGLPASSRIASGRKPEAPASPRRHVAARRQGRDGLRRPVEAAGAASSAGKLVSKVSTTHAPGSPTLAVEARRPAPGRNSTTPGSTQSHLSLTAVSTGTPALSFGTGVMLAEGHSVPNSPGGRQQLQRPEQQGTPDMPQHVEHELGGLAKALALQLPGLLGQLKVLLEAAQQPGQPAAHDLLAGGACWGAGTGQEHVARRAAVQECVEELQSRMACLLSRPGAVM